MLTWNDKKQSSKSKTVQHLLIFDNLNTDDNNSSSATAQNADANLSNCQAVADLEGEKNRRLGMTTGITRGNRRGVLAFTGVKLAPFSWCFIITEH